MKLNITNSAVTDLPTGGEWIFIQSAVGDIDVTFVGDSISRTITIGQGEMIEMPYTGLQFQARGGDQEIEFRIGWGKYTPNITAVTSTLIESIKDPVQVSSINSAVAVSGITNEVAVSGITNEVAVSGITNEVAVSGIANEVAVSGITNEVAVSGITNEVAVSGITNEVAVSGITNAVKVTDTTGDSFISTDYTVPAESYIDIPTRDRAQVFFQSLGKNLTRCRVSDTTAIEASGLWLVGGGEMFGESPILRTKAALRIWNTSDSDAVITVNEVY